MIGCGTNPPPVFEAKALPTAPATSGEVKIPPKPEKSDEAGAKLLAEVLAAHGGADKLAALRTCSFTRKGTADAPGSKAVCEWVVALDYPTRYRLRMQMHFGANNLLNVYALNPAGGWSQDGNDPPRKPLQAEQQPTVAAQMHEDSVALLFPFTDPKAVVVRATADDAAVIGGKPEFALHIWTPGVEFVRVWVNPATKRITRFAYQGREGTLPTPKEVIVSDYKEIKGLTLPSKMAVRAPGRLINEWSDLIVDMAKPDEKKFDAP